MTDQLVRQLTRELGLRASDMSSDPTLAPRVLHRAGVVRRRRTIGVSVTAAVAVAAVAFVTTGPDLRQGSGPIPPPATRTSTPDTTTVPASGPIEIGYAVNGLLRSDGTRVPTVVELPASNGVVRAHVQLPQHWVVQRVGSAGSGLVIIGMIVTTSTATSESGDPFSAYVSSTGQITKLSSFTHGAFPVARDGSVWATAAPGAPVDAALDSRVGLNFVRPDSDTTIDKDASLPVDRVIGAVGPRAILLQDPQAARWVWTVGGTNQPGAQLKNATALWDVVDSDLGGAVLLRGPDGLHLLWANGAAGWNWPKPAARSNPAFSPSFSPDGSKVAADAVPGLVVLAVKDGSVITGGTGDRLGSDLAAEAWEGNDNLLVVHSDGVTPSRVERCSASSGRCSAVEVDRGNVVLAGAD